MDFASRDAGYVGNVSQNSFKDVIAQRPDLCIKEHGRMLPPASDTMYYAGLILAQYTSGPNAGLWAPYNPANSSATDGSQTPKGILLDAVTVGANGSSSEIVMIVSGIVYSDLCYTLVGSTVTQGMTDAIVTGLVGKRLLVGGQNEVKF